MLLYHGCSSSMLGDALKEGIVPRGDKPSSWRELPSHPGMVYLTDTYPFYYASNSRSKEMVVFEIDGTMLDESRLFPDEDYLVEIPTEINLQASDEHTPHQAAIEILKQHQQRWQDSLSCHGTCCHEGTVNPDYFTRYCVVDRVMHFGMLSWFTSPELGIEHHKKQQVFQKQLICLMFGDCSKLPGTWEKKCKARLEIEGISVHDLRGTEESA